MRSIPSKHVRLALDALERRIAQLERRLEELEAEAGSVEMNGSHYELSHGFNA
jgi:phage shock protein A